MTRNTTLYPALISLRSLTILAMITSLAGALQARDSQPIITVNREAFPVEPLVHDVGSYRTTFPGGGFFGVGFTGPSGPSFEYPADSHNEYLFGGALWVGGIVNGDTLVSTGTDGWSGISEFTATAVNPPEIVAGPADQNFQSVFYDTAVSGVHVDPYDNRPHIPLGIKVTQTSHALQAAPFDDAQIVEFDIVNISADTIYQMWLGIYMDCDIGNTFESNFFVDDITGFLDSENIAYIFDNDGHSPVQGKADWDSTSVRGAFGVRILDISPAGTEDPNFNWWISNGNPALDFGPRQSGTPTDPFRDFGLGGSGTPVGDKNKYYILSHRERDYDQYTAALDHTPEWLAVDSFLAGDFADGFDTRFLISDGGFDLPPGDTAHMVIGVAVGADIHSSPTAFRDLWDKTDPQTFTSTLDFLDLIADLSAADSAVRTGFNVPVHMPPPAPTLRDIHADTPVIDWIFSTNRNIEGYDVFLKRIPDSLIYCDLVALDTPALSLDDRVNILPVLVDSFALENLTDGAWYVAGVALRAPADSGAVISESLIFRYGQPTAPQLVRMYANDDQREHDYGVFDGPVRLEWNQSNTDAATIRIYRTADTSNLYHSPRVEYRRDNCPPADSGGCGSGMLLNDSLYLCALRSIPHKEISADNISFLDYEDFVVTDAYKYWYQITVVDSQGYESPASEPLLVYSRPESQRNLGLYVFNDIKRPGLGADYPELISWYKQTLQLADGDVLFRPRLISDPSRHEFLFETAARYRKIIIDDPGIRWSLFIGTHISALSREENALIDFTRMGGDLIYFGGGRSITRVAGGGVVLAEDLASPETLTHKIFGLDSTIAITFLSHDSSNISDTLFHYFEPAGADPANNTGLPPLTYHHSGWYLPKYYNTGPMPFKGVLFPQSDSATVLYTYRSGRTPASLFHGQPVGVKYTPVTHTAYTFFFEPWELDQTAAEALLGKLVNGDIQTDAPEDIVSTLPKSFELYQNYPNPFNPATTISYALPVRSQVNLTVYNILGQKVRTLVNDEQSAGRHKVIWNAKHVATGIYFYRLKAGKTTLSRKMILLK